MSKVAILALAGLGTSTALAQQSVTLHFDVNGAPFSGDAIDAALGDTLVWTVYASFTGFEDPTAYFGGFVGDFLISNLDAASVSNVSPLMANVAIAPNVDQGSVTGVNMFNSALLGSASSDNPIAIMTFETQVLTADGFSYSAAGISSVFPTDDAFELPIDFEQVTVISDLIVIPAPGAVAIVGLAGLVTCARRRS